MDPRLDLAFAAAQQGDPGAFRSLIEALAPDLVRFATFLLDGDHEAAQDIVQDVLVEAWRELGRIETPEHLRRWTYRVARCRSASWRRRHGQRWRRLLQLSALPEGEEGSPLRPNEPCEQVSEGAAVFDALRHALVRLPRQYGAPVQLHYLQGFDVRETALLLGLSPSSVKMRLVRARERLRRALAHTLDAHAWPRPRGAARPPRQGGPHAP